MNGSPRRTLTYRRSNFATRLPTDYLYTTSHYWLEHLARGGWRVGLTKFAARMLGEMVDHGFTVEPGSTVDAGQALGWVEGFKAIADVYAALSGRLISVNPALIDRVTTINRDPYGAGWLYVIAGEPDGGVLNVKAYKALLDQTIDRLRKQRHAARKT